MLVGNTVGASLLLGVSMNARLKVGGIMTAIPYPLLGLAGGAPIALLSMMWLIGLAVAVSGATQSKYYLAQGQAES